MASSFLLSFPHRHRILILLFIRFSLILAHPLSSISPDSLYLFIHPSSSASAECPQSQSQWASLRLYCNLPSFLKGIPRRHRACEPGPLEQRRVRPQTTAMSGSPNSDMPDLFASNIKPVRPKKRLLWLLSRSVAETFRFHYIARFLPN